MTDSTRLWALKLLLRIGGVLTGSAFLTLLMTDEQMASTHASLGMGELPRLPIVEYLARSVSAFYGFHGILLFVAASDPIRLRPIVTYLACFNIVFGMMLVAIDVAAGMPSWWTAVEGPGVVASGILLAVLNAGLGSGPSYRSRGSL